MIEESEFKITSIAGLYNTYGVKNVLEVLDPNYVPSFLRSVSAFCQDTAESFGDIKYEISHAIGGGYLFKSKFFPVAECATVPLRLTAIFSPIVGNQQTGFKFFLDFVHDDILSLTRIDQEFNLIKYFCIE